MKEPIMRYLPVLLILFITSCISVSRSDLNLIEMDEAISVNWESRQSPEFWEAMRQFDFSQTRQLPDSSEYKQFAYALHLMISGEHLKAVPALEDLVHTSSDSLIVVHSGTLLTGIYMLSYDWEALIKLDANLPAGLDDMSTIDMVTAWSGQEAEQITYPMESMVMDMDKSISGTPTITVLVNGIEQTFWIDTGAEFTVLASDVAEACGVRPLHESPSLVGTSTDKQVGLWAGVIEELKIEDLLIENHPVFIISKEDLEFKLLKIFKILKIDGILGWNAIQNLKLELNSVKNTVTLEKPERFDTDRRNFHYLTQPFITVSDTNGVPLNFFLDTGANKTSLYSPAYAYFDTSKADMSTAMVGGAGGAQKVKQLNLSHQSLLLGKTRINFPEIQGTTALGDTEEGFIHYDGIIGSDIYANGILILDFQNGICELKKMAE